MLWIVRGIGPKLDKVTCCGDPICEKVSDEGEKDTGPAVPPSFVVVVPVKRTDCAGFGEPSAIFKYAVRFPAPEGVNVTCTVQLVPASRGE